MQGGEAVKDFPEDWVRVKQGYCEGKGGRGRGSSLLGGDGGFRLVRPHDTSPKSY